MAFGPGKYDSECTQIMVGEIAEAVLVIVLGGKRGSGFSCQATPAITFSLPRILRNVADEIEKSGVGA
jgi:hypothetical protein